MPPDVANPKVTVCVVVKDRREMMSACLDGLARQSLQAAWDLVVIDNGSTDGTFELLQERAATFRVPMQVRRVAGPLGRARQAALDATRAPVMASTDSDCVPTDGWLAALLERCAPGIDVVQGRTLPAHDAQGRWPKTISIDRWTDRYETCNIAYRVSALRAAGGFDVDAGAGGEDTSAGWRVRRRGGGHAFAPAAVVHHAVTYPGLRAQLRFARSLAMWPGLVREFPEMRRALLTKGAFLRPRSLAFDLALAGACLAGRQPLAALLLVPYARHLRPSWRADRIRGVAEVIAYDCNVAAGLLAGSLRHRALVA
jgi:hypothetical protein